MIPSGNFSTMSCETNRMVRFKDCATNVIVQELNRVVLQADGTPCPRQYKMYGHCIGVQSSPSPSQGSQVALVECDTAPRWVFENDMFRLEIDGSKQSSSNGDSNASLPNLDVPLCVAVSNSETTAFDPLPAKDALSEAALGACDPDDKGQLFAYDRDTALITWLPSIDTSQLCFETDGCQSAVGTLLRLSGGCSDECYVTHDGQCSMTTTTPTTTTQTVALTTTIATTSIATTTTTATTIAITTSTSTTASVSSAPTKTTPAAGSSTANVTGLDGNAGVQGGDSVNGKKNSYSGGTQAGVPTRNSSSSTGNSSDTTESTPQPLSGTPTPTPLQSDAGRKTSAAGVLVGVILGSIAAILLAVCGLRYRKKKLEAKGRQIPSTATINGSYDSAAHSKDAAGGAGTAVSFDSGEKLTVALTPNVMYGGAQGDIVYSTQVQQQRRAAPLGNNMYDTQVRRRQQQQQQQQQQPMYATVPDQEYAEIEQMNGSVQRANPNTSGGAGGGVMAQAGPQPSWSAGAVQRDCTGSFQLKASQQGVAYAVPFADASAAARNVGESEL